MPVTGLMCHTFGDHLNNRWINRSWFEIFKDKLHKNWPRMEFFSSRAPLLIIYLPCTRTAPLIGWTLHAAWSNTIADVTSVPVVNYYFIFYGWILNSTFSDLVLLTVGSRRRLKTRQYQATSIKPPRMQDSFLLVKEELSKPVFSNQSLFFFLGFS